MRVAKGISLAALLIISACQDPAQPNYEFVPEMVDPVPYEAFSANAVTRSGKTMMAPAPGTIPRGVTPFHYGTGPEEAE